MKPTFLLSEEAESDLDEAFLWYESQLQGLGRKFINSINEGFSFIQSNPESTEGNGRT